MMHSMEPLEELLEQANPTLRAAVEDAEAEIEGLRRRIAKLEGLIRRAKYALGEPEIEARGPMTLHEALNLVLRENGNRWMAASELTSEINARGLYRMRDGRPLETSQVHARVRNYEPFFEIEDGRVRLRLRFDTAPAPARGAYWAARTVISEADDPDRMMEVVLRVAYGAPVPDGQDPQEYAVEQAERLARRVVSQTGFSPGSGVLLRHTSSGIEELDE